MTLILCAWQTALFPAGYSEGSQIEVGQYRTNEEHIISGMFEREKIHYIAPSSERVEEEMQKFLNRLMLTSLYAVLSDGPMPTVTHIEPRLYI